MMRRVAAGVLAVLFAFWGAPVPAQQKMLDISIGATSTSPSAISFILHPVLSENPEFFRKVGLNFDQASIQMGNAVGMVQSGNPPVIEGTGVASVGGGWEQGTTDVKIFMGELQKSMYQLVVRKGITKFSEIKTLGVPSIDSASSQFCQSILKSAKLVANKDYQFVLLGTSGARVAAVQAGKVDGSCELVPFPELYHDKYGMTVLQSNRGQLPYFAAGAWAYNVKWGADPQHRETVVRLAEAILLAIRWIYDPANKAKVIDMAAKGLNVPDKYASYFYDQLIGQQAYTPDGYLAKPSVVTDAQIMVDIGLVKSYPNVSQYFDWSILQEAAKRLNIRVRKPEY
jgi:ABC-type nitrate/sulfonate/bicarbonate transport system substrate-binding protein